MARMLNRLLVLVLFSLVAVSAVGCEHSDCRLVLRGGRNLVPQCTPGAYNPPNPYYD